jgi:hypothetical protein
MKRLKASHPGLDHQAAFKIAASSERRSQTLHCMAGSQPVAVVGYRIGLLAGLHAHCMWRIHAFAAWLPIPYADSKHCTEHAALASCLLCIHSLRREEEQVLVPPHCPGMAMKSITAHSWPLVLVSDEIIPWLPGNTAPMHTAL